MMDDVRDREIDPALGGLIAKAYAEHRDVLFGVAFKLCRNKAMSRELVTNALGAFLTGDRTYRPDVPMVTQLCNAIGTLWSNQVTVDKRRRTKKSADAVPISKDPQKLLEKAEHDVELEQFVDRIRQELDGDALAIHALEWILDDDEPLAERARRLGIDKDEFALARKRALYAARKVADPEMMP